MQYNLSFMQPLPAQFANDLITMWVQQGQTVFTAESLMRLKQLMTALTYDVNTIRMWQYELNEWEAQKQAQA